jgi:hypothetical protein
MSEQPTKEDLVAHCDEAAKFYSEHPGLSGYRAVIDLYCVCEALAQRVEQLEAAAKQSNQ